MADEYQVEVAAYNVFGQVADKVHLLLRRQELDEIVNAINDLEWECPTAVRIVVDIALPQS